jgi:hypothetical protein
LSYLVFDAIFRDDASCLNSFLSEGYDTLICGDGEVFHPKLAFFACSCRKYHIITILKVMTQIILTVRIEERIDEIDCVEEGFLVYKKLVDVCVGSTGVGEVRGIRAPADRYF